MHVLELLRAGEYISALLFEGALRLEKLPETLVSELYPLVHARERVDLGLCGALYGIRNDFPKLIDLANLRKLIVKGAVEHVGPP